MDWEMVLKRYRMVALLNEAPGSWFSQTEHGRAFRAMHQEMEGGDLRRMLRGESWIACYAPPTGTTDRIEIDLDGSSEESDHEREARYWAVRRAFGAEHVPLVYATPSGVGLRVVYRTPTTTLETLVTGVSKGAIADHLRSAGLAVRPGALEVYPQRRQANRLPLGRAMPILDPVTLRPVLDTCAPMDDEDALLSALSYLEEWHAAPCVDLVERIRFRVRVLPPRVEAEPPRSEPAAAARPTYRVSAGTHLLLCMGLQDSGTRYDSEWRVGLALVAYPERYPEYGLGMHTPSDEQLARALATWLATRNNDCSQEWTEAARKRGPAGATEHFVRRYLAQGPGGNHLIDRLRRTLTQPGIRDGGREITDAERAEAMRLSARFGNTAMRYRFECWCAAFYRARRSIVRYHASRDSDLAVRESPAGGYSVVIPIAAKWMERWPYGSGSGRYPEYRAVLVEGGLLERERPYVFRRRHSPGADVAPREATGYRTLYPIDGRRPVGIPWRVIAAACRAAGYKRDELRPDEAYHVLYLAARADSGLNLEARYGRRTAKHVRDAAMALRTALEDPTLSGSNSVAETDTTGFAGYRMAG